MTGIAHMHWLGLDIGGANIKLADGDGYARSHAFALWQRPDDLAAELRRLISAAPPCTHVAVTMTGELADCYATKTEGVQRILDAVQQAIDARPAAVYLTTGELASVSVARRSVSAVAAANWHAVAQFAQRFAGDGPALLIDIGSTTSDLIPLSEGTPAALGVNDTERLLNAELIYSGVMRTPVCGLVNHLPWHGSACPVAREWFADTHDAYLLLGDLPEDPADRQTADGQPATQEGARRRFARMVCADPDLVTREVAVTMAAAVAEAQQRQIADGLRQVIAARGEAPQTVVISGEGEFLARRAVQQAELAAQVVSLGSQLGHEVSRCAPAHAVAVLAAEARFA